MPVLRTLYGLALGVWTGIMVYFSALMAPALARHLPDVFPRVVSLLFPGYFRAGMALAAVALAVAALELLAAGRRGRRGVAGLRALLALAAFALVTYNGEVLLANIRAARGDETLFAALHARSMAINGLTALLALLGALLAHVGGSGRRSEGWR